MMAKKRNSRFIFFAHRDMDVTLVFISTRETWEKERHSSDRFTDEELAIIELVGEKYGMYEGGDGIYDCELSPKDITDKLNKEPDFAYDQSYADFVGRGLK